MKKNIKRKKMNTWHKNMILSIILTVILLVCDNFLDNIFGAVAGIFLLFFIWILMNQYELLEKK